MKIKKLSIISLLISVITSYYVNAQNSDQSANSHSEQNLESRDNQPPRLINPKIGYGPQTYFFYVFPFQPKGDIGFFFDYKFIEQLGISCGVSYSYAHVLYHLISINIGIKINARKSKYDFLIMYNPHVRLIGDTYKNGNVIIKVKRKFLPYSFLIFFLWNFDNGIILGPGLGLFNNFFSLGLNLSFNIHRYLNRAD